MSESTEFMVQAQFGGPRFEESGIPPEVYGALSSWHQINGEVLKHGYRTLHGKGPVPDDILNDYETSWHTEAWSPIVEVHVRSSNGSIEYIESGYGTVMDILGRKDGALQLPRSIASKMMPIYKHLESTDGIMLSSRNLNQSAWLGKEAISSMSKATPSSTGEANAVYMERGIRGAVYVVDIDKGIFGINSVRVGRKIPGLPLSDQNSPVVIEALQEYGSEGFGGLIELEGVTTADIIRGRRVFDDVQVTRLPRSDVPNRLEGFRKLKQDWAKAEYVAPDHGGLDWLADRFASIYPRELELPHVYPTPEGGVEAEWLIGDHRVIFEIDLKRHSGDWLQWDKRNEEDEESRPLDLDQDSAWRYIVDQVKGIVKAR